MFSSQPGRKQCKNQRKLGCTPCPEFLPKRRSTQGALLTSLLPLFSTNLPLPDSPVPIQTRSNRRKSGFVHIPGGPTSRAGLASGSLWPCMDHSVPIYEQMRANRRHLPGSCLSHRGRRPGSRRLSTQTPQKKQPNFLVLVHSSCAPLVFRKGCHTVGGQRGLTETSISKRFEAPALKPEPNVPWHLGPLMDVARTNCSQRRSGYSLAR